MRQELTHGTSEKSGGKTAGRVGRGNEIGQEKEADAFGGRQGCRTQVGRQESCEEDGENETIGRAARQSGARAEKKAD
jgi:hypothetical protein